MAGLIETPDDFSVSQSSVKAFRECEQLYQYQYGMEYVPRERELPLERGSGFHDYYLEPYYQALKGTLRGVKPEGVRASMAASAHERALELIDTVCRQRAKGSAQAYYIVGGEKAEAMADEFLGLADVIMRIAERYYKTHGADDAIRYVPLLVESKLPMRLAPGIVSHGRLDMVTHDLETGHVALWEHKTTMNEPPENIRVMDLQTLLYRRKLRNRATGVAYYPDMIIWNYLHMKEPTVPEVLKKPKDGCKVTVRKNLDSTWEVYAAVVRSVGDDPMAPEYDSIRELLTEKGGRELRRYFPRYEKITLIDENIVMGDYLRTAQEIQAKRAQWLAGTARPVRALNQRCGYCSYSKACMAALVGGDEGDEQQVLALRFHKGRTDH